MFLPTHLLIVRENARKINIKLLQEVKNFKFEAIDDIDDSVLEFDINNFCLNKSYMMLQIKIIAGRVYIAIDRITDLYKFVGGINMKRILDLLEEDTFGVI